MTADEKPRPQKEAEGFRISRSLVSRFFIYKYTTTAIFGVGGFGGDQEEGSPEGRLERKY